MCDHGRGLDGRTVARGRHRRQAVQARLGRRTKWRADGQADGPNRAKIAHSVILVRDNNTCMMKVTQRGPDCSEELENGSGE